MDNNYEWTVENPIDYEETISAKDLFASILDKWVFVLIFIIIGALIGLGIYAVKSNKPSTVEITQESIDSAKESLNIEQIEQVDHLYAQYKSYKAYRKMIQEYLADSLDFNTEDMIRKVALYQIKSDIHGVNSCFMNLAVGNDEMEQIAAILGKDPSQLDDDVYRRVRIANMYSDLNDGVGLTYEMSEAVEELPSQNIIGVGVNAETEEQADQMLAVIADAFQREADELRKVDPDIQISEIGYRYSSNFTKHMENQRNDVISSLNDANNQINSLQSRYIDKLDTDEKAYFDAMKNYDEQDIQVVKKPSIKKLTVIGAAAGLVVAVIIIILWYVFNRRIKTADDVAGKIRKDVPYVLYKKKPGFHLFGVWSRILKGADLSDIAIRMDLVAKDLVITLKQMNCKSVYIMTEAHTPWAQEVAEKIREGLDSSVKVHIGNPLKNVADLKDFAREEAAIMLVQLKETKNTVMERWIALCWRHERKLAGAVVIEEC